MERIPDDSKKGGDAAWQAIGISIGVLEYDLSPGKRQTAHTVTHFQRVQRGGATRVAT